MTSFAFTVDGRPQGKGRPRTSRFGGRPFTPAATVKAERAIATEAMIARGSRKLMTGTVRLSIEAVFRIPKGWSAKLKAAAVIGAIEYTGKPDLDNIVKLVSDALNGVVYLDDAQVQAGTLVRRYGSPERVEVIVEELAAVGPKSPAERRREKKLAAGIIPAKRTKRAAQARSNACEEPAIGKRIK